MSESLRPFWLSWVSTPEHGPFTLHWPWWISGHVGGEGGPPTVCAAVRATDEAAARRLIVDAHDVPPAEVEFRFCEPRPADWSPFNDRFAARDWMRW